MKLQEKAALVLIMFHLAHYFIIELDLLVKIRCFYLLT